MMNLRIIISGLITTVHLMSCSKEAPEPEVNETKQDRQVRELSDNSAFTTTLGKLATESKNIDFEAGYFLYPSASQTFRFERVEGKSGEPSITLLPKGQIAGVVHCHYNNLFPTFSGSDIKAIFELYTDEHMHDYNTFFCGVVTYTGRGYLLLIEDLKKFMSFSENNLTNREHFRDFELSYFKKQQDYLSVAGFEGSYDMAIANLLSGSGLTLYRSNMPFQKWQKLTFEKGKLKEELLVK